MGTKLITLILVCAPILGHAARPLQNAYLNHPVTSVSGLIAEIKRDPQVADRYMRHFGMSKDEVIAMFSKMHLAHLDRDTPVSMFSVPQGGAIKTHRTVMKKGELVFEDADGNVILKVVCGNPVVGGREHTEVDFAPETENTSTLLRTLTPDLSVNPEPSDAIATILPPETTPDIVEVVPQKPSVIQNITNVTNNTYSGGGCKGLAGLLLIVPLVFIANHHDCCNCPPPTPTPEPVSMTLLATGAIGLVARRRRSRG